MKAEYLLRKKDKWSITIKEIQAFPEPFIRDKVIRGI